MSSRPAVVRPDRIWDRIAIEQAVGPISYGPDVRERALHIREHFTITVTAMAVQPSNDALHIEAARSEKRDRYSQCAVAFRGSDAVENLEQVAQVLATYGKRSEEHLPIVPALCFLALVCGSVSVHGGFEPRCCA